MLLVWFSTGTVLLLDICRILVGECNSQVEVHWSVKMSTDADWQLLPLKTSPRVPSSIVSLETSSWPSWDLLTCSAENACSMHKIQLIMFMLHLYRWKMLLCHGLGKNVTLRSQRNPWKWIQRTGRLYSVYPANSCKPESTYQFHGRKSCPVFISLLP